MKRELVYRSSADRQVKKAKRSDPQKYTQLVLAFQLLEVDPFHPRLRTTPYASVAEVPGASKDDRPMYHSRVPGPDALRIHWVYGASEGEIEIIDVIYAGPHL